MVFGKTATIIEAFKRNNLRYLYFSGSTIDPMTELVGVPKEYKDPNSDSKYLDYIRPKYFAEDEVDAIFVDEYNRSSKRTKNSLMELIQFKSINGKKLNNLKIVWTAINPIEDDDNNNYDVEELDPAQLDRFQVIVDVPYLPSANFFRDKYGKDMADVAIDWWKKLTAKEKNLISPRRLDYALDIFSKKGDIRHVIPKDINTSFLIQELSNGSFAKRLADTYASGNKEEARKFINIENNYSAVIDSIIKNKEYKSFFLPLLNDEKLSSLMHKDNSVKSFVFNQYEQHIDLIKTLSEGRSALSREAKTVVNKYNASHNINVNPVVGSKRTATGKSLSNSDITVDLHMKTVSLNNSVGIYSIHTNVAAMASNIHMIKNIVVNNLNDKVNYYNNFLNEPLHTYSLADCMTVNSKIKDILTSSQINSVTTLMPKLVEMFNMIEARAISLGAHSVALSERQKNYLIQKYSGIFLV